MSASVLPQPFTTDVMPPSPPLVRSINEMRWWGAVLYLDENPDKLSVEVSPPRQEWTWRLERTSEKFVYSQNTLRKWDTDGQFQNGHQLSWP